MVRFDNHLVIACFSLLAVMNTVLVFYPKIRNALPGYGSGRFMVPAVMGALGWYAGLMNGGGAMILGLFSWCCAVFHGSESFGGDFLNHNTAKNRGIFILRTLAFLCMVAIFFGILHHKWPGFFNVCALSSYKVSERSVPYTMWFNFDRTLLAMILCMYVDHRPKPPECSRKLVTVLGILAGFVVTVTGVALCALVMGYIEWDIKWPSILGLWSLNNIFFICFAEEVWFRGFLQNQIKQGFTRLFNPNTMLYRPYILAASVIFGIDHFIKGGPVYGALAVLAGLFYGVVYDATGRIQYAWVVHFLFNLFHMIVFTYPASTGILSR
jgi:membrane protease YdiL (CAAX protease family)